MRMNNVEVHIKKITNEWKIGDRVKDFYEKGFICEINKNYYAVIWDSQTEGTYRLNFDYGIINLSAIGRKAALASSKKVGRDSKGRFESIKVDMWKSTYGIKIPEKTATEVLFWHRENTKHLESLEKRIEALEKQMNPTPEYIKWCGGANGCNGTC